MGSRTLGFRCIGPPASRSARPSDQVSPGKFPNTAQERESKDSLVLHFEFIFRETLGNQRQPFFLVMNRDKPLHGGNEGGMLVWELRDVVFPVFPRHNHKGCVGMGLKGFDSRTEKNPKAMIFG